MATFTVLAGLLLSGCAHQFLPGPGMTPFDLSRLQGSCRLMSRQHDSGFSAAGRAGFVAAAAATSLVIDGIRTASDYNDCMTANGALISDGRPHEVLLAAAGASSAPPVQPVGLVPGETPLAGPIPIAPAATPRYAMAPAFVEERTPAGERAISRADTWMKAQAVLNRGDRNSRDLYLVLCGAGDRTSCVMAAALNRT